MAELKWLHLTDLHQGLTAAGWLWPEAASKFFADLRQLHRESGPWDLVLFTGDLTNRGTDVEFAALDVPPKEPGAKREGPLGELFVELGKLQQIPPLLLTVPGNHDLVRPAEDSMLVEAMAGWHGAPAARRNGFWAPLSEKRKAVGAAFERYRSWHAGRWEKLGPEAAIITEKKLEGLLPGDFSVSIEKDGLRLAVVGLNSAFLQLTGDDYEGKLDLDVQQLQACIPGNNYVAWIQSHHAALLLTHHPPTWLEPTRALPQFQQLIAPPGRFAAHLCGHLHKARAVVLSLGGSEPWRTLQGRSLFGLDNVGEEVERSHGYMAGSLTVDAGGKGTLRLWPRSLQSNGPMQEFLGDREGFQIKDGKKDVEFGFAAHQAYRPVPPADKSVAPESLPRPSLSQYDPAWYVPRPELERAALDYLRNRRPVVLLGPSGSGKTWLFKHILDELEEANDYRIVEVSLGSYNDIGQRLDIFLLTLAYEIAQTLGVDVAQVADRWTEWEGRRVLASQRMKWLMEQCFLPLSTEPFVLALDAVDAVLEPPLLAELAAMLRAWIEAGNRRTWARFRLILTTAAPVFDSRTEGSSFFGLARPIDTRAFGSQQTHELTKRLHQPWTLEEAGGLADAAGERVRRIAGALYDAAWQRLSPEETVALARARARHR